MFGLLILLCWVMVPLGDGWGGSGGTGWMGCADDACCGVSSVAAGTLTNSALAATAVLLVG